VSLYTCGEQGAGGDEGEDEAGICGLQLVEGTAEAIVVEVFEEDPFTEEQLGVAAFEGLADAIEGLVLGEDVDDEGLDAFARGELAADRVPGDAFIDDLRQADSIADGCDQGPGTDESRQIVLHGGSDSRRRGGDMGKNLPIDQKSFDIFRHPKIPALGPSTCGRREHARFAWLSGRPLTARNVPDRCNRAARHRWDIEEHFRITKWEGYQMTHAFSWNGSAMRCWHYLMLLACLLNTLACYSTALWESVRKRGLRGTILFLRETYLGPWLNPERLRALRSQPAQLRLVL